MRPVSPKSYFFLATFFLATFFLATFFFGAQQHAAFLVAFLVAFFTFLAMFGLLVNDALHLASSHYDRRVAPTWRIDYNASVRSKLSAICSYNYTIIEIFLQKL